MLEEKAVSNLSENEVKFLLQEHGRTCFENQALRGEVNRLQQILQAAVPAALVAPEAPNAEPIT